MLYMEAKQIIKSLGGVSATARLCKISRAAVSQWQADGIPQARMMFLELARPDVFQPPGQATEGTNGAFAQLREPESVVGPSGSSKEAA